MLEYSAATDYFLFIWAVLQQALQRENYKQNPYQ